MSANDRGVAGIGYLDFRRHPFARRGNGVRLDGGQSGLFVGEVHHARSSPQPHPKKLGAAKEI